VTPPTASPSLVAQAMSTTEILLTWEAATDDVGIGVYHLERCVGEGCTGFTNIVATDLLTWLDADLTPDTTYRYRVIAYALDDEEEGPPSAIAEATTDAEAVASGLIVVAQALAAALVPLGASVPGLQVTAFLNPNPTPPSIDIYPADLFQQGLGFGIDQDTFWTIRARTTTADHESGQRALLALLDRSNGASVENALVADQTLGGAVQSLAIADEGVSGYRVYLEDPTSGGHLIGVEWRVEVVTK